MNVGRRRAVVYGLVVAGAFVAIDVAVDDASIGGAYALGAIVTGVLAGFEPALGVAGVAVALVVVSGAWNHDFGSTGYFTRLFVAGATGLLAAGAGRLRDDNQAQLARQELLGAVADLPQPGETLERTLARVVELLVPRYARFAALEGGLESGEVRLAARGTEPLPGTRTIKTPLRARGRAIGSLTISGGRAGSQQPEFLRILSGGVAFALDNAGLSQELMTAEQQLQAILSNLGEAVTVQERGGRLVYANRAAATLLGAPSVDELLATPPEELMARFTIVTESGMPVDSATLPGREVLEGHDPPPLLMRVRDNASGEERWRLTKSTAVHGPGGEVLLAVNVIEDVTEVKRAEFAQRLLSEASALLASSLDYESTLERVAELAVPALADWCSVSIPRGDVLEAVAVAHRDPELLDYARQYAERWPMRMDAVGGEPEALRTGEPLLVREISPEMVAEVLPEEQVAAIERLAIRSVILAPMIAAERRVGVLTLGSAESGRRFGEAELEVALELARRAATAIENARLHTELERVATTLQRSLLPPHLPDVPGWRFEALYMPSGGETEVGGDFYDVFPTAAGWMVAMGDVVGRGPAAAALTAMGRYTLRTAASLDGTPTTGLARLNENLRQRGDMALCTAAVVLLRAGSDEASLVCAGHPLPYLIRAGEVTQVGRVGPMLGAFDHGQWQPATLELTPGDVLVLYTDGVMDARGDKGRFGEERLHATLTGATSASEAVARIQAALAEFADGERDDDAAVLALEKLGALHA